MSCSIPCARRWLSGRRSTGGRATARRRGLDATPEWLDVPAAVAGRGGDLAAGQAAYRHFVLAAVGCEDRLWDKVTNAIYLGSEDWTKRMRKLVESRPRATDHLKA